MSKFKVGDIVYDRDDYTDKGVVTDVNDEFELFYVQWDGCEHAMVHSIHCSWIAKEEKPKYQQVAHGLFVRDGGWSLHDISSSHIEGGRLERARRYYEPEYETKILPLFAELPQD